MRIIEIFRRDPHQKTVTKADIRHERSECPISPGPFGATRVSIRVTERALKDLSEMTQANHARKSGAP